METLLVVLSDLYIEIYLYYISWYFLPNLYFASDDLELSQEIEQMIAEANVTAEPDKKRPTKPVLSSAEYIAAMKRKAEKKAAAELKKHQNREKRLSNAQKNVEQAALRLERIQKQTI